MKEKVQTYLFIAVVLAWPIVQFLVFWLYTNIQSIMLAFAKVDVDLNMTFNGLNNFKAAFADFFSKEDISLRRAFINSFTRYFATNIVTYTIPIIFGFIIFKKFPLSGIARYCVMLPSIISSMMTSLVFEQLVHSLPKLFAGLGIVVPDMLIDPAYSFQTMTFFAMWTGCTSCAIMYPNMFNSVDTQLHEAAEIDGANKLVTYFAIIMPLAKAIFATVAIFTFMGAWNEYVFAQLMFPNPKNQPLQVFLQLVNTYNPKDLAVVMAALTFSTIPIAIVYIFCQRYIVEGVSFSGLK